MPSEQNAATPSDPPKPSNSEGQGMSYQGSSGGGGGGFALDLFDLSDFRNLLKL
jgi:hypothetical protein